MIRVPNSPPGTIFKIDLKPLKGFLVDLPPGATIGMRHEQPKEWPGVVAEIVAKQPDLGKKAGISTTDYNRFLALNDQHQQILVVLPTVAKAVEVLEESLAHVDNLRHRLLAHFATCAESHARMAGGDPTLLTAYEKAIAYRGVIASKSAKTKKKNEEAEKDAKPAGPEAGTPAPAAPAPGGGDDKGGWTISRVPAPPPESIFAIDLNPLKAFLVDLPPGATKGMRQEQDGWEAARQEIIANQQDHGDAAGITDEDFNQFVALCDQYAQIRAALPVLQKAKEVLEESLAYIDNLRHQLVTHFAGSAEEHANIDGGDPTLLTAYQQTIRYRGIVASKGARTRKQNGEAAKAGNAAAGATGPTGATGATGTTSGTGPAGPAAPS